MKRASYPGQGIVLGTISTVTALVTMVLCNVVQTLSFVLLPLSRSCFRAINTAIAGGWWSLAVIWSRYLLRSRIRITGDPLPPGENAIVFANHQQMPDIVSVLNVAYRSGMIRHLKWFAKDSLKWFPGVGWGLWCIDGIFLKRNWEEDRGKVVGYLSKYKREQIPVWVCSFPEGTRLTPSKLAATQEFARGRGLPVLNHVLLPRPRGFVTSVEGLREYCTAVYSITIYYRSGVSSLWRWMRGLGGNVDVLVRRYPMADLPTGEKEISDWLRARFVEMDRACEQLASVAK